MTHLSKLPVSVAALIAAAARSTPSLCQGRTRRANTRRVHLTMTSTPSLPIAYNNPHGSATSPLCPSFRLLAPSRGLISSERICLDKQEPPSPNLRLSALVPADDQQGQCGGCKLRGVHLGNRHTPQIDLGQWEHGCGEPIRGRAPTPAACYHLKMSFSNINIRPPW